MTDHVILPPDQILTGLTVAQLENLITDVVRRVVREEMRLQTNEPASGQLLPESFLATFGVWEDVRPPEVIASEIYESRTLGEADAFLKWRELDPLKQWSLRSVRPRWPG